MELRLCSVDVLLELELAMLRSEHSKDMDSVVTRTHYFAVGVHHFAG